MTADYKIEHWTYVTTKKNGSREDAVEIFVNDQAATREAIIFGLRRSGITVKTRSDWHAKMPPENPSEDWNYTAIALHHAGNSFSCNIDGIDQLRKAEAIDFNRFKQFSYHYAIDCYGTIYEALDIRQKGSHVKKRNTGVIGIVFLSDFSIRGEAGNFGPGIFQADSKHELKDAASEFLSVVNDEIDVVHDEPTKSQINSIYQLVAQLKDFFDIKVLGGHREFAQKLGTNRPCPGRYGMILASLMRRDMELAAP